MTRDEMILANIRIVLVEDDADSRALFKKALESEGFDIVTISSGAEALEYLESAPSPHLILVDISMPNMGGEEFVKRLQQNPCLSATKVLLISGWDDIAKRALALGVDGYIRKPVQLRTLRREISRHLMPDPSRT